MRNHRPVCGFVLGLIDVDIEYTSPSSAFSKLFLMAWYHIWIKLFFQVGFSSLACLSLPIKSSNTRFIKSDA